jgi:RNA polymerase sigma-70 factor (sigma-E family)
VKDQLNRLARGAGPRQMQDALRDAFETHYLPLVRLGKLLSGRRELAEDMVQDAFARAAPFIATLAPDEVGAYLRQVILNSWRNRLRRLAVEQRARALLWRGSELHPVGAVEDRESMWQTVMRLPERQRACLVLRYYEDLSEREIARLLGCSKGTVKSHLSRALKRLRKEYGHEY